MGEDWRIEEEYMQQGLRALGGNPEFETHWFTAPTEAIATAEGVLLAHLRILARDPRLRIRVA